MSEDFAIQARGLRDRYRPLELKGADIAVEWWEKHLALMVKHRLTREIVKRAAKDVIFRDGAPELLNNRSHDIQIISSGLGDVIVEALKGVTDRTDILIVANFVHWQNGYAQGYRREILTAKNKGGVDLSYADVCLGDGLDDLFPAKISYCFSDTDVPGFTRTFPTSATIVL